MAEAVLYMTQETLRNLLLEEAKFLYGVKDQVKEIQKQLEIMKSYLKDADRRQHTDETVRTWVKQVRRLAYRTEDVLETYAVEVASGHILPDQEAGWCIENVIKRFAFIFCECFALHNVGKEIEKIKSEINDLNTSRQTYGIGVSGGGESSSEANEMHRLLRQTYAHDVEEHFVGMKDDIKTLVSLITDNERDHRVISIWGIGGLGKSTLAKKIFNHGVVQRSFEAFAWVCVTQQSQIHKVLQDILKQILGKDMQGDQPALVRDLQNVFREKKCLIVLDDIWRQDDWEILRPAFSMITTSSKVLLTTRSREVAKKGFLHELSTLTEEESWELLRAKALTRPQGQDFQAAQEFERIGKKIVRKCRCLPLAISTLGGILREKDSLEEWNSMNENISMYLRRGEDEGESSNSIMNVLVLSYNELPYYLKPCFLYMGNFQEDEEIRAKKLYQLWIAEGLVLTEHCRREESMMDVAERYLGKLVSRCMVEVKMDDKSTISRIKSCRLHDLMRDLCLDKGKEEEFFDVIDVHAQDLPKMDLSSFCHNERRLGVHIYDDDDDDDHDTLGRHIYDDDTTPAEGLFMRVYQQLNAQVFRTLYVRFMNYRRRLGLGDISGLKEFKLLRVLRLENCTFEFPEEISQLMRLRYLSIEGSVVSTLPLSMSNLSYLQTLDLRIYWESDICLPDIFWKMKRLKHIYLPSHYNRGLSINLQFNSELETLSNYQSEGGTPADLAGLVNLRHFRGELDNSALSQFIDTFSSSRKIKGVKLFFYESEFMSEEGSSLFRKLLLCENLTQLYTVGPIHEFPPYEPQFWPNLTSLSLKETEAENDPMQFLAQLPNLRELALQEEAFMGKEMVCDATAFPQLRSLHLDRLPNLETLRVDEGAMPNLSSLYISRCPELKTITNGLNFSTIQTFRIQEMPEEFEETYRTRHEQARSSMVNRS